MSPAPFRFSQSKELDVVLHDSRVPALLDRTAYSVLPVEAVYGVVEVMSELNRTRLTRAHAKLVGLKKQPKMAIVGPSNAVRFAHYGHHWPAAPIQGFIVAFRSKLGLPEIQRHLEQLHGSDAPWHRVDSVWVLDRGYVVNWFDSGHSVHAIPTPETRLRAGQSTNPMPLFLDHLQTLYWDMPMPETDLTLYGTRESLQPNRWLT